MNISETAFLTAMNAIRIHEGFKSKPYLDSRGVETVGYGRNLKENGVSEDEARLMLRNDLAERVVSLSSYDWFNRLNDARKVAILDMAYQLGTAGVCGFYRMIAYLEAGDFMNAGGEILASHYYDETPTRAYWAAAVIRDGAIKLAPIEYPVKANVDR